MLCWQNGKLTDPRRMAAGFSAGITEALIVVTPFEVVKIRLQQQRGLARDQLRYKVGDLKLCLHFDCRLLSRIVHVGIDHSPELPMLCPQETDFSMYF